MWGVIVFDLYDINMELVGILFDSFWVCCVEIGKVSWENGRGNDSFGGYCVWLFIISEEWFFVYFMKLLLNFWDRGFG